MKMKSTRTLRGLLLHPLSAALLLSLSAPAAAQVLNNQSLYARDTDQGVFVRDSAIAVEKLALAERMEHLKEWDKAADVYQEIIKTYADRVVPSQVNKDNRIYQYSSVTPFVHEHLAKWPAEGLAVYRARYETEAGALLETAGDDLAHLRRVMNLYFVTESAKKAGLRQIDLYLERGEFSAAAWTANRLLEFHPGLEQDRPRLLFRAALASNLAGDIARAQTHLKELTEKFSQASSNVRGGDVNLAETLSQELIGNHSALRAYPPESWPTIFGGSDRSRVPTISAYGGARLFSLELERPNLRSIPVNQRASFANDQARDAARGLMTGIFPVIDRGEMFFQDNTRIYAVNLESGYPLAGWAENYAGDRNGRYSINAWTTPRGNQCTLTLTDDSVLAVMGLPDLVAMARVGAAGMRETRLVCLDRRTGKERWVTMPKEFVDDAAGLRHLDLNGSPLVIGDTVYVQGRGGKGMQFEDSYVLAFNLSDGKFRWASYVASANTVQSWQADQAVLGQNNTHLAYSNGRVFALTNLGAVAALDAYDGSIAWLNIYPRESPNERFIGGGFRGGRNLNNQRFGQLTSTAYMARPWPYNPVIVSQGKVFILPRDGSNVHIYDSGTGAELKRIDLSRFGGSDTMLGVVGEKLVVNNDVKIFCIDWVNYDPDPRRPNDSLLWSSSSLQSGGVVDNPIMGRGFVTADSVLVPTARKLFRLKLDGGLIVQTYPNTEADSWSEDECAGNLLLSQDRLIIAGATSTGTMRVNVYTDLALATAKLEADIKANPNDPILRLRFADILFAAGSFAPSIDKLDEAVGLLSAPNVRDSGVRDRIFETAVTFAQKLAKENRPQTAGLVESLFDRALAAAITPTQKVQVRLHRAANAKVHGLPDQEIKLYQQILLDPTLRVVPVAQGEDDALAASDLAFRAIDDAIQRAGGPVYAPYERAAADLLLAAARTTDPNQLQTVAQSYPNSTSAPRALLLAAEMHEAANNSRLAVQVLRQAYFRYPKSVERERIIESLARNMLRLPNRIDVAIARLNQAASVNAANPPRLTKPLILPDGSKIERVSFAEAAEALKRLRAQSSGRELPDVGLIATAGRRIAGQTTFRSENRATIIENVGRMIVPPAEFERTDRVITYTQDLGVRVFPVGKNLPILTSNAIKTTPDGAAWNGSNLVVWSDTELGVFAPDRAQTAWTSDLKGLVAPQVATAARVNDPLPADIDINVNQPQPNIVIRGQGRIIIDGNVIIGPGGQFRVINQLQAQIEPTPRPTTEEIAQVRLLADRVIVATNTGRILALDLTDGKLLWQTLVGDRAPTHLLATDDFVVVRSVEESTVNSQLAVFDSFSGQMITRRGFGAESPDSSMLYNVALASDGTLVWLTSDKLLTKDLFQPGGLESPTNVYGNRAGEGASYQLSTSPEHLQIAGDRIIVTTTDTAGSTVRILSLHDGVILRTGQSEGMFRLDPSTLQNQFFLRVAGSSLYISTARKVSKVDLINGSRWPETPLSGNTTVNARDMVVTKGHLLIFSEPSGTGGGQRIRADRDEATAGIKLHAFSRALDQQGVESGLYEHDPFLADPSRAIRSWQVVNGGIYYQLAGEDRLHFLQGAKE